MLNKYFIYKKLFKNSNYNFKLFYNVFYNEKL